MKSILISAVLLLLVGIGHTQKKYQPRFWVDGIADDIKDTKDIRSIAGIVERANSQGWGGVMYWGGQYVGENIHYNFKSTFLQQQSWAKQGKDGLTPLLSEAHKKDIKVMVNLEGMNPYHWKQHHWTAANIAATANNLAEAGIDGVFEECFETNQPVFTSLARTLKSKGVAYMSGTDPMLLRENYFSKLWPETGIINIYDYYIKRNKLFSVATLAQNGSLGLGWAKYWNKPLGITSTVTKDWGIANEYSPAVVEYLCMIRALQFRVENFFILGGMEKFNPVSANTWIQDYISKQEDNRPLMNIIVALNKQGTKDSESWNHLFNSADAITSGAFNAGYNIIVSDKVLNADAYWVFTEGGKKDSLTSDITQLFASNKPVFIQAGNAIPSSTGIDKNWEKALMACGVDGTKKMFYTGIDNQKSKLSLPEDQAEEIPYTGYYNDQYLRFTGTDIQRGTDLRGGTIIQENAIHGQILAYPNTTYGKGPYIIGKDKKYLITTNTLNAEVSYVISKLLSGSGVLPTSNVWGIAGKNVTAMLAIETTELSIEIPSMEEGAKMRVLIWDNKRKEKLNQIVTYKKPFVQPMSEYDFILIERLK